MKGFIYGILCALAVVGLFIHGTNRGYTRGYSDGYTAAQNDQKTQVIETMVSQVTFCESSNKHEGVWGKAGEYGVAQFKPRTFQWMARMAGHPEYRIGNRNDQIAILRWAIKNGYGNHWSTCYKKAATSFILANMRL
jgi:hypothetical protein